MKVHLHDRVTWSERQHSTEQALDKFNAYVRGPLQDTVPRMPKQYPYSLFFGGGFRFPYKPPLSKQRGTPFEAQATGQPRFGTPLVMRPMCHTTCAWLPTCLWGFTRWSTCSAAITARVRSHLWRGDTRLSHRIC